MRCPDPLSRSLLVSCLFFALAAAPAFAQGSCDLEGAEDSYRVADFDVALMKLESCRREIEPSRLWEVYRLLASIHIARDEIAQAREAVVQLLRVRPGFEPDSSDPLLLSRLVEAVRSEEGGGLVTAASRTGEEVLRAPATLEVVTAAQLERRGYLDLAEVFQDLPGFGISRGNGEIYSNLHPRGFRATANDRMLLLVDGVEQNDLSSGTAHISRQYSLLNVERVEVLYGPASALYGANAYSGVINVVTRAPDAFLEPGESIGGRIAVTSGSLDTEAVDFTLAGRPEGQSLAWSVTGRLHRSSELDLSRFDQWDYRYDVDYGEVLRLTGEAARRFAQTAPSSALYTVVRDASGAVVAVEPTAQAELLARDLDQRALSRLPGDALSFSDDTEDWSLFGKVRMANLVLGFQTWRRKEGTTSGYTELERPGQDQINVWTPSQTAFFINFSLPLPARDLLVRFAARYRQSGLDGDATSVAAFRTYFSGDLGLRELVRCEAAGQGEECREGGLSVERFSQLSTQVTGELSLVYDLPQRGLSAVGGVDLRIGSIQGDFGSMFFQSPPAEHTDVGLYAQATFSPPRGRWEDLKLVAAGRFDFNRIDTLAVAGAGYGSVFSPRLAVVYDVTDELLLKAIYSRGLREPSDLERFARVPGLQEVPGGRLEPEQVDNLELGLGWHQKQGWWPEGLKIEIAGYRSDHSELLRVQSTGECLKPGPAGCEAFDTRLRNTGELRTQGGHLTLSGERRGFRVFGNYTYTDSRDPAPTDGLGAPLVDAQGRRITNLRLTDLARHRANLGFNSDLSSRWNLDLRFNYAAERRAFGDAAEIPSYLLTHATASYRDLLPGMTLQLVARNLFDEQYADPGALIAGQGLALRIPQPGRTLYFRLLYQRQRQRVNP